MSKKFEDLKLLIDILNINILLADNLTEEQREFGQKVKEDLISGIKELCGLNYKNEFVKDLERKLENIEEQIYWIRENLAGLRD